MPLGPLQQTIANRIKYMAAPQRLALLHRIGPPRATYAPGTLQQAIAARVRTMARPQRLALVKSFGPWNQNIPIPSTEQPPVGGAPGQTDVPPPLTNAPNPVPGRGGPLSWNPQLVFSAEPALAQSGALDSQYTAAKNAAMSSFYSGYHDILKNLGYMSDQGDYVTGEYAQADSRQRALYNMNLQQTERDITDQERERGTLFSGIRGTHLAEAQRPDITGLSDLDMELARETSQGYTDIGDVYGTFNRAMQQAVMEAIARRTAELTA